MLRFCFDQLHAATPNRAAIPPFFVFRKAVTEGGRSVEFLGVAVPGAQGVSSDDDLVAIWRTSGGERFQNYRAIFTILDIPAVSRTWINDLYARDPLGPTSPEAFRQWAEGARYRALEAPRTLQYRTVQEQMPAGDRERAIVQAVYERFADDPYRFEACAAALWRMLAGEAVTTITGTRPSVDGGRDAFGLYSIGPAADRVHLDFSLEAKCYRPGHGAGVRDLARLISRLRHRQFGVFVTTSHVGEQAYRELREDGHPVVIIAGHDIGNLLRRGYGTVEAVEQWLNATYPREN